MREVIIKTCSPTVTEENFIELLNTDELFCDYFNAFLRLPSFIEPLVYNRKTGLFEVLTDAPKELARKIKSYVIAEHRNRHRPLFDSIRTYGSRKSAEKYSSKNQPPFDTCFAVETLERESGTDWIRRNRLPLFLESNIYMEYRLASLMGQVEEVVEDEDDLVRMKIDYSTKPEEIKKNKITEVVPAEETVVSEARDIVTNVLKFALNIVSILDEHSKDGQKDRDEDEDEEVEAQEEDGSSSIDSAQEEDEEFSSGRKHEQEQEVDFEKESEDGEEEEEVLWEEVAKGYLELRSFEVDGRPGVVTVEQFKDMVDEVKTEKYKKKKNAVSWGKFVEGHGHDVEEETDESLEVEKKDEEDEKDEEKTRMKREVGAKRISKDTEITGCSEDRGQGQSIGKKDSEECHCIMRDMSHDDLYDDNISITDSGSVRSLEPKCYALKRLKGVEQFKASLSGLPGEKRWNLWLDIEKAKLIKDERLFSRHIACMKDRYDRNGGLYELAPETREELGLQDPTSWQMNKLLSIQEKLVEPLLLYWVPAFLVQRKLECRVKTFCALEELRQLDPPPESYPHQRTLPPLPFRPQDCLPRGLHQTSPTTSLEEAIGTVDRSETNEWSSGALLHEPSIPEDEILLTPTATSRRSYVIPERSWSLQVNRRKHWREVLEEQEAGWYSGRSSSSARKSFILRRLPSVGEFNENYIRKEVTLGQRNVPAIMAATRKTSEASLALDSSSEFCGGERMEGLLQALDSDNEAGAFFLKELEKYGNQLWLNALMFWKDLQAYHEEVFRSPNDLTLLEKKAKQVFAEFISSGAPFSLQCTKSMRDGIYGGLNHPTDELFDEAEKYALTLLFAAWMHVIERDLMTFDEIRKIYMLQTLDQGSKYVQYVQKRGLSRKKLQEPVIRTKRKLVYSKAPRERLPSELRSITLDEIKRRVSKFSGFRKFLADNFAGNDLQCLHDIEMYRRIPRSEGAKVVAKAMDIKWKYYNEKYLFGPNSPADKEGQDKIVELTGGMQVVEDPQGVLEEASIYELEKYVRKRLEEKWLPLHLTELAKKEAKKGRTGSRLSSEQRDVKYARSRQDKKRGPDGMKKRAGQTSKEGGYRLGAGLEGPGSGGSSTLSSWEQLFYTWALDREKVLNLFPRSKLQASVSGLL